MQLRKNKQTQQKNAADITADFHIVFKNIKTHIALSKTKINYIEALV